jgi:hypothetical protein
MERAIYGATNTLGRECGYADPDGLETVPEWRCVEGCPVAELDGQSGERGASGQGGPRAASYAHDNDVYGKFASHAPYSYDAKGGASRFFYCSKASRRDRGEGNGHPTVKPTDLMRWLVRLITPPGGLVLDPFAGSGSTGKAAAIEGFRFLGIEREAEYVEIARARIAAVFAATPLFRDEDAADA